MYLVAVLGNDVSLFGSHINAAPRLLDNKMISIRHQPMDNRRLDELISRIAKVIEGELGFWRIDFDGRQLLVITDESHNRMRVMTVVVSENEMTDQDCKDVLAANFDRALDAKYAVSSDYLWSVFMHPLADLSDEQFVDAVKQVKTLADNYGTTYSSSDLVFGGGG
jgi:hypothetical protein